MAKGTEKILLENIKVLSGSEFKTRCPQAYKNVKGGFKNLIEMHLIALDNVYNENVVDKEGNVSFFASISYLADRTLVKRNSTNQISKRIVTSAYHKLLNKLSDDEIEEKSLKKSKKNNVLHNKKHRKRVNWYSIPSYTVEKLDEVEKQAKKWKEMKYTTTGTSREMFLRAEGLDVANELYPQYEKITKKINGELKTIDRLTSEKSDDVTNEIVTVIFKHIEELGYSNENLVIEELSNKYSKSKIRVQLKKSLKEMLDVYELKKVNCTKSMKSELGILTAGYPAIFIKDK